MNEHYHFIGIGGIGMGALASLVLLKGKTVSGSDIKENNITKNLSERGAKIFFVHEAGNIKGADVVIYSSAIDPQNAELLAARKEGKAILKRAQLLAELMKDHISVTVAGAHGKTTTTSMISHMLSDAQFNPTTAVGGIVNELGSSNAKLGEGKYFVAEVDESDGSFLYFTPQYSVITNIDIEHLDYYGNLDNIIKAYRQFIDKTAKDGVIVVCGDDQRLSALLKMGKRKYISYGFSYENEIIAKDARQDGFQTKYDCLINNKNLGEVVLNVPGKHNILNSLACIAVGINMGIDFSFIQKSLVSFEGVRRRFQVLGCVNDIMVIDDYAHHPTEIKTVLETAALIKKNRLIAVFQPHRYSRLQHLMDDFIASLKEADCLVITDVYAASEKPIEGVSSKIMYEKIQKLSHKPVHYVPKLKVVDQVLKLARPGDLVVNLGAGDITHLAANTVQELKKKYADKLEVIG